MTPTGSLFFEEMLNAILGKKIEQSQYFKRNGQRIPVTLIAAGPCFVVQIKTEDKDGYGAIQLGFGRPRFLREIRFSDVPLRVGQEVKVGDVLKVGDIVAVTGLSGGKGFSGVVKRWGFSGGPRTHGQSDRERAPGSIGSTTTPGRVYKGKKMAGRMGGERVTLKNLEVIAVDQEKNLLTVKGLVPGRKRGLLLIKKNEKSK